MIFAFISALCFSLYFTLIKRGLIEYNPGSTLVVQLITTPSSLVAFMIIAATAALTGNNIFVEFKALTTTAYLLLISEGLLGPLLGMYFTNMAIKNIGAAPASALRGTNPLFATFLSVLILHEQPEPYKLVALVFMVAGIILVSYRGRIDKNNRKIICQGIAYAILAAVTFSLSQVVRGVSLSYGATPNTAISISLLTAVCSILLIIYIKEGSVKKYADICKTKALHYYLLAGVCLLAATYSLILSFTIIPVWLAVAVRNTQPLFSILTGWIFLRKLEPIDAKFVVGASLIVIGIWIISMP